MTSSAREKKVSESVEVEEDDDLTELIPSTIHDHETNTKQHRRQKLIESNLSKMMYGGGDDRHPLKESIHLVQFIITDFVEQFSCQAKDLAQENFRNQAIAEDFMFLIRKDIQKYRKATNFLNFHQYLNELRKKDFKAIEESTKNPK